MKNGLGAPQKNISLKRMISSLNPDIILIQETMCSSEKSRETFESWLKNWSFYAVDAEGMYGGGSDFLFSILNINIYGP
jgi:exonuclease III